MSTHFVTGASGFLGRHLVRALLERGEQVIVLLREHKNDVDPRVRLAQLFPDAPTSLSYFVGDITKGDLGLSKSDCAKIALSHPEVWHLAADLSFDASDRERIFRTNVEGTKNVVHFANAHAKRLWHMSTAYVQGEPRGVIMESTLTPSPQFRNNYEETKYRAEEIVRTKTTIPFLIIRPSIILGDAYREKALGCAFGYYRYLHILHRFKNWIIQLLQKNGFASMLLRLIGTRKHSTNSETELSLPWLFLPEPRNGKVNVIPVAYVIDALLILLPREHKTGTTIHLVHHAPPTYSFLLDVLLLDLHMTNIHHLPVSILTFTNALRFLRRAIPSMRVYAHSALWYVPYITDNYKFETTESARLGIKEPPLIDKAYMTRVNNGAINVINSAR